MPERAVARPADLTPPKALILTVGIQTCDLPDVIPYLFMGHFPYKKLSKAVSIDLVAI